MDKIVREQHFEVGVHAQRHDLRVVGRRVADVLGHAFACTCTASCYRVTSTILADRHKNFCFWLRSSAHTLLDRWTVESSCKKLLWCLARLALIPR